MGLSDLMSLLLTWGVYIANGSKEHSKTHKRKLLKVNLPADSTWSGLWS
jgi:hypothetical protein